jgi:hypothetical protein
VHCCNWRTPCERMRIPTIINRRGQDVPCPTNHDFGASTVVRDDRNYPLSAVLVSTDQDTNRSASSEHHNFRQIAGHVTVKSLSWSMTRSRHASLHLAEICFTRRCQRSHSKACHFVTRLGDVEHSNTTPSIERMILRMMRRKKVVAVSSLVVPKAVSETSQRYPTAPYSTLQHDSILD